jgi:N6-adenosine-specific RNA methylase IME4
VKFPVIVADPPWSYEDKLRMGGTVGIKRSADSHYSVMHIDAIKALQVPSADEAFLALWCPNTLIESHGLPTMKAWGMKAWGFVYKGVYTWVKTAGGESGLAFGMGRYFRGCSELALFGVRGRNDCGPVVLDKAQRNVCLHPALPHSQKPELPQDSLEKMYAGPYLEMFARRDREGWYCIGNEAPDTMGEDITVSLGRLVG